MHGNVPFGMPGRVAASYAHKALDSANKVGTGMLVWLMQLIMQMLMEVLTRHHEQNKLKDYEAMMERVRYLEDWCRKRYLELDADQSSSGQMTELGQKMMDLPENMAEGLGIKGKSPEEQAAWAEKLIERYNKKHGIKPQPKGPKGPTLEM